MGWILRERIISEILALTLADNTKARLLFPDGSYHRAPRPAAAVARNSQAEFIELARNGAPKRQAAVKAAKISARAVGRRHRSGLANREQTLKLRHECFCSATVSPWIAIRRVSPTIRAARSR